MITEEKLYAATFANSHQQVLKKWPMFIQEREIAFILYLLDIFSEERTVATLRRRQYETVALNLSEFEELAVKVIEENYKLHERGKLEEARELGLVARKIRRLAELLAQSDEAHAK